MVFIWRSGGRGRRGGGYGPGWGPGYGRGGYGGPPPGYYGRGYGGGGGGGCLRDLLLLDTGCCLAESLGCGMNMLYVAPTTARHVHRAGTGPRGTRMADKLVAAVRVYQREVSAKRAPCCRFEPSCSNYAVEALESHGAARGSWLTLRRLVRCRPGARGGADPVPAAAA